MCQFLYFWEALLFFHQSPNKTCWFVGGCLNFHFVIRFLRFVFVNELALCFWNNSKTPLVNNLPVRQQSLDFNLSINIRNLSIWIMYIWFQEACCKVSFFFLRKIEIIFWLHLNLPKSSCNIQERRVKVLFHIFIIFDNLKHLSCWFSS